MIPRIFHKWYAKIFGYFWLPCPSCGRMFGGHEWKIPGHTIWEPIDPSNMTRKGKGTCPNCPIPDPDFIEVKVV